MIKEQQEAIQISDDQEPIKLINDDLAPTGNSAFDVQYLLNLQDLKNHGEEAGSSKLHKRLNKFFEHNKRIHPGKQYFAPKKQPDLNTHTLPNAIVVHGIDYIKLKKLKRQLQATSSTLLDNSNCVFFFNDEFQARQALKKNMVDPSILECKSEIEAQQPPRGWFQLKSYSYMQQQVKMCARFATSQEQKQGQNEKKIQVYRESRDIFNCQEEERQREKEELLQISKERKELLRQNKSEQLYDYYGNQQGQEWKEGTNYNPGAHRQRSRSRDRMDKKTHQENSGQSHSRQRNLQIEAEQRMEMQSNSSFVLNRQANQLTARVQGMQLNQGTNQNEQLNLSLSFEGAQPYNEARIEPQNQEPGPALNQPRTKPFDQTKGNSYNWGGASMRQGQMQLKPKYKFSYSEYMRQKEIEEEQARTYVNVIELDD